MKPHHIFNDRYNFVYLILWLSISLKAVAEITANVSTILLPKNVFSSSINSLWLDSKDNVYIADPVQHVIFKFPLSPGSINSTSVEVVLGILNVSGSANGAPKLSTFSSPYGVTVDGIGGIYVADSANHMIRRAEPNGGQVSSFAGAIGTGLRDAQGSYARFNYPMGLSMDPNMNDFYVVDTGNHAIRKVTNTAKVTLMAGNGLPGFSNSQKTSAQFNYPRGCAADIAGNVIVTDSLNHVLRKITAEGQVFTFSGAVLVPGFVDGDPTTARYKEPFGIVLDSYGNFLVSDDGNKAIRLVDPDGVVLTVAGGNGTVGNDDGPGLSSRFSKMTAMAASSSGSVYLLDVGIMALRKIDVAGESYNFRTPSKTNDPGSDGGGSTVAIVVGLISFLLVVGATVGYMYYRKISLKRAQAMLANTAVNNGLTNPFNIDLAAVQKTTMAMSAVPNNLNSMYIDNSGNNHSMPTGQIVPDQGGDWLPQGAQGSNIQRLGGVQGAGTNMQSAMAAYNYQRNSELSNASDRDRLSQLIGNANSNMNMADVSKTVTSTYSTPISIPGYLLMDLNEVIQLDEQTEEFGAGGTASIVKGRLKTPELIAQHGVIDVAIKVINSRNASSSTRDSFLYEVALMTAYPDSDYLVKIIGYSENPMTIIMKFYPFSLKDILKRPDFENNVSISFKIALDIAIGMSILHNKGIIHFDLKPGNILVDVKSNLTFNCVICDFGFANFAADSKRVLVSGLKKPSTAGITARYASPELFQKIGDLHARLDSDIDKKIDVYAYGLTVYGVVTRENPWGNATLQDIETRVCAGERPPLEVSEFIPPLMKQLIERCWAQNPLERPSFDEVVRLLTETFSHDGDVSATMSSNVKTQTATITDTEQSSSEQAQASNVQSVQPIALPAQLEPVPEVDIKEEVDIQ